ncbi:hypothetical protein GCM10010964_43230 [Caldovatus sediminis]|uniref:Uncharacterized protein n=1 Tax=Caldovatus sediminis TaxID=2041189 RepID=A0A8J2ZG03_9PROT|nr:hypothetical protein GCM10010964_43230 [Caldovatus sediminis]
MEDASRGSRRSATTGSGALQRYGEAVKPSHYASDRPLERDIGTVIDLPKAAVVRWRGSWRRREAAELAGSAWVTGSIAPPPRAAR